MDNARAERAEEWALWEGGRPSITKKIWENGVGGEQAADKKSGLRNALPEA